MDRLLPDTLPFELKYLIDGLLSFGIIIHAQVHELVSDILPEFNSDRNLAERILMTMFRGTRVWDLRQAVDAVKRQDFISTFSTSSISHGLVRLFDSSLIYSVLFLAHQLPTQCRKGRCNSYANSIVSPRGPNKQLRFTPVS